MTCKVCCNRLKHDLYIRYGHTSCSKVLAMVFCRPMPNLPPASGCATVLCGFVTLDEYSLRSIKKIYNIECDIFYFRFIFYRTEVLL